MKTKIISLFLTGLELVVGACHANVSRNNDGPLAVETTISQQELQDVI